MLLLQTRPDEFKTVAGTCKQVVEAEGFGGLYYGMQTALVKSVLANAFTPEVQHAPAWLMTPSGHWHSMLGGHGAFWHGVGHVARVVPRR